MVYGIEHARLSGSHLAWPLLAARDGSDANDPAVRLDPPENLRADEEQSAGRPGIHGVGRFPLLLSGRDENCHRAATAAITRARACALLISSLVGRQACSR